MNEIIINNIQDLNFLRYDSYRCYRGCSNYNCCNRCCGGSLYPCPIYTNNLGQELF